MGFDFSIDALTNKTCILILFKNNKTVVCFLYNKICLKQTSAKGFSVNVMRKNKVDNLNH